MDEKLSALLKNPDNKTCFDCGTALPKWASVNNSVFVCLNCAGIHRGVGVNYSFIRSLTMDNWDTNQIKLLSIGGNSRMKLFLQEFGIPLQMKIDTKYRLKALDYYRKMLRAEAFDEPMPIKPDIVSAFEVVEEEKKGNEKLGDGIVMTSPMSMATDNNQSEGEKGNDFFLKIGTFFQNSANDIQKGFQDLKLKEKANDFEQKAIAFKNKTIDVIEEKKNVAVTSVSSFFQKTIKFFSDSNDEEQPTDHNQTANSSINPSPHINLDNSDAKDNDNSNNNNDHQLHSNNEDPNRPPQI